MGCGEADLFSIDRLKLPAPLLYQGFPALLPVYLFIVSLGQNV
jgi:hypothetical protein